MHAGDLTDAFILKELRLDQVINIKSEAAGKKHSFNTLH